MFSGHTQGAKDKCTRTRLSEGHTQQDSIYNEFVSNVCQRHMWVENSEIFYASFSAIQETYLSKETASITIGINP